MSHLTYLEAAVVGLVQGVSEMFPVSSLGHNVLIPAIVGGSWARDLNVAAPESPYLAVIVGLHVATALALLVYFWRDWIRIGRPIIAGVFLAVNGVILIAGERYRSRASLAADAAIAAQRNPGLIPAGEPELVAAGRPPARSPARTGGRVLREEEHAGAIRADRRLAGMSYLHAAAVGSAQILALLAGISRDGVTMVAGMARGLSREDAARFAFLLATPAILGAGVLKIPDLLGPLGNGIRGPVLLGSVLAGIGAYLSVRFLLRYLRTRTLTPFGIYCLIAGAASVLYLGVVA
jgi:undecaprenyl-diphosphatase